MSRTVSQEIHALTTAQQQLVEKCLPLAYQIGRRMYKCNMAARYLGDEEEVISIGKMGLIRAAIAYDSSRANLTTYAHAYIKGYIQHAIAKIKHQPAMLHFDEDDGTDAEEDLFFCPLADPVLKAIQDRAWRTMRRGSDMDSWSEGMLDKLPKALATLDARQRQIITLRFLDERGTRTLKEVGKIMGVSHERIRQLQEIALGKLADHLSQRRQPCGQTG